ncbi:MULTISPECIES: metallophosphoesterase [Pseudomonadaceae]|uniref:Metallophosphoesterase n=1 Tax=Ectopseudomonas oleovorans (strain CECT 5344) TaxID=1182590 RepID=W6R276_ECTO5|nr:MULTISPECIES: metallophosphoesterase [Pseudomonas]CDR92972.1 Metallophosphoesterase [Pseudomonas oleovorans]EKU1957802.1 metallophosphoesterase [Pseudomonas aeruginosa]EMB2852106.1 metallophosphoesterase [Pseudomonas aeruginosa]KYO79138.1 Calcineurin-like phosphoesterase superfamily domain protein [Pseudomonas aeruginosa]MDM9653440.1 metallophosphoesterase [Pseudomonas wenzhouensis]
MRIHLLSDLHNEFSAFTPEQLDCDVVILAGDIDLKARGVEWAKQSFSGPVLYVPGNHEFYGGHLTWTLEKLRAAQDDRVRVLDRDELILAGVRFLGATMWTDFEATGNPHIAAFSAQTALNDFRQIRAENYRRIRPADLIARSVQTKDWLRDRLAEPFDGPTVVITHHAPTLRSLQGNPHAGTDLDAAFANRWEDLMGSDHVALWVHGHSHTAVDYELAGTRVVSNPRGYPGEETGFCPDLVIEV